MKNLDRKNYQTILIAALVVIGVFLLDLITPLGVAGGVFYIFALFFLIEINQGLKTIILYFAMVCSALTLFSMWSLWPPVNWMALVNRGISLFVIWSTSFLIIHFIEIKAKAQEKIQESEVRREELEKIAVIAAERSKAEARFRLVVDSAPNAMIMVGIDGLITLINNQAEKLFGYSREELIAKPLEILIPKRFQRNHSNLRHHFFQKLENRSIGAGRDLFALKKNGKEVPVEIGLNPIETEEGQMVLAAIIDITNRKKQENTIKTQLRELADLNKELEHFSYVLTHDLRQPMANLANLSNLLKEEHAEALEEEGKYIVSLIATNANKADTLVQDMLEYARANNVELKKSAVNLKELFVEEFKELKKNYATHEIIFDIIDLPLVLADKSAIRQVCQNLLSNALKYSSKKAKIHIQIGGQYKEKEFHFLVKDNGVGFDDAQKHKIFIMFQRLHAKEFQGIGIGMAICQKIVEKHGGRIWAESMEGEGASFYFTLPLA